MPLNMPLHFKGFIKDLQYNFIDNYLGRIYCLPVDEIVQNTCTYIIQESKNSTLGFLLGLSDIKDVLFKLILYSDIDTLYLSSKSVNFKPRLKLTGRKVIGSLSMPCDENSLIQFSGNNKGRYSKREEDIIYRLNQEASNNKKLEIQITHNIL